jgi:hypothetical protein
MLKKKFEIRSIFGGPKMFGVNLSGINEILFDSFGDRIIPRLCIQQSIPDTSEVSRGKFSEDTFSVLRTIL